MTERTYQLTVDEKQAKALGAVVEAEINRTHSTIEFFKDSAYNREVIEMEIEKVNTLEQVQKQLPKQ
jgi:hypothetical protein